MMIKIGDYEISFFTEKSSWAYEKFPHVWRWTFEINWLSPYEKEHREFLREHRMREKALQLERERKEKGESLGEQIS